METLFIFSTYNYKLLFQTDDIIAGRELFSLIHKFIENIDYVIVRDLSFDEWLVLFRG